MSQFKFTQKGAIPMANKTYQRSRWLSDAEIEAIGRQHEPASGGAWTLATGVSGFISGEPPADFGSIRRASLRTRSLMTSSDKDQI